MPGNEEEAGMHWMTFKLSKLCGAAEGRAFQSKLTDRTLQAKLQIS
jgi:hypothetical protein